MSIFNAFSILQHSLNPNNQINPSFFVKPRRVDLTEMDNFVPIWFLEYRYDRFCNLMYFGRDTLKFTDSPQNKVIADLASSTRHSNRHRKTTIDDIIPRLNDAKIQRFTDKLIDLVKWNEKNSNFIPTGVGLQNKWNW